MNDTTSYMFLLYFAVVVFDCILGSYRAWKLHKVNSTLAKAGMIEHALLIFVPMVFYPFADVLGFTYVADTILTGLIVVEGYSVVENWIACGFPFNQEWLKFFDDKKLEQKMRVGTVHTEEDVPEENDKRL